MVVANPNGAGDPLEEYKDVSANMRQYGNLRFAQLTLFVALSAGLMNMVLRSASPLAPIVCGALKCTGIVITIVCWLIEERTINYWRYYRRRAIQLEELLGYQQYSRRPEQAVLSASNAVRILFGFVAILWLVLLLVPSLLDTMQFSHGTLI